MVWQYLQKPLCENRTYDIVFENILMTNQHLEENPNNVNVPAANGCKIR